MEGLRPRKRSSLHVSNITVADADVKILKARSHRMKTKVKSLPDGS